MAEERTRAFILATMFFWEGEVGEVLRVCASFFFRRRAQRKQCLVYQYSVLFILKGKVI